VEYLQDLTGWLIVVPALNDLRTGAPQLKRKPLA
jgi:hypothetical protein